MTKEKGKNVWLIMLIVSCLFIGWAVFTMSNGSSVLERALSYYAGSPLEVESLDNAARDFLTMAMMKPLWEEIGIGVIGIFCAIGLKQRNRYAWILGIIWGATLIADGLVQGGYEMFILNWAGPCPQTYIILALGIIPVVSLIVTRKVFTLNKEA